VDASFQPDDLIGNAFGIIRGARTSVRLWFDASVARIVERRSWHPSQKVTRVTDGIELALVVDGTDELLSWVLSFGEKAMVLEPEMLRAEARKIAKAMLARYEVHA
jgi:predicted DNA-binding transcriptional regulator YafY